MRALQPAIGRLLVAKLLKINVVRRPSCTTRSIDFGNLKYVILAVARVRRLKTNFLLVSAENRRARRLNDYRRCFNASAQLRLRLPKQKRAAERDNFCRR